MTPKKSTRSICFATQCIGLGLAICATLPAAIAAQDAASAVTPESIRKPVHRGLTEVLDKRVQLLAAELNLDADQQAAVRRLLMQQREQTLKVWNDEAVPAALRIKATQGVAERTADQIRALLDDVQRTRYSLPHKQDAEQHFASEDLESWMRGSPPKGPATPQQ